MDHKLDFNIGIILYTYFRKHVTITKLRTVSADKYNRILSKFCKYVIKNGIIEEYVEIFIIKYDWFYYKSCERIYQ